MTIFFLLSDNRGSWCQLWILPWFASSVLYK